jgi:hypothetical protein
MPYAPRVAVSRCQPGVKGQAMAEFALVTPVLILLFFGMTLAAFYVFRAGAADWGVFIAGVASGAYQTPATDMALDSVAWPDIRAGISAGFVEDRQVRSRIAIEDYHPWVYGLTLIEAQRAAAFFRQWRFYPGPPPDGGIE